MIPVLEVVTPLLNAIRSGWEISFNVMRTGWELLIIPMRAFWAGIVALSAVFKDLFTPAAGLVHAAVARLADAFSHLWEVVASALSFASGLVRKFVDEFVS